VLEIRCARLILCRRVSTSTLRLLLFRESHAKPLGYGKKKSETENGEVQKGQAETPQETTLTSADSRNAKDARSPRRRQRKKIDKQKQVEEAKDKARETIKAKIERLQLDYTNI